jgi:hypothetical protein
MPYRYSDPRCDWVDNSNHIYHKVWLDEISFTVVLEVNGTMLTRFKDGSCIAVPWRDDYVLLARMGGMTNMCGLSVMVGRIPDKILSKLTIIYEHTA